MKKLLKETDVLGQEKPRAFARKSLPGYNSTRYVIILLLLAVIIFILAG